MVKARQVASSVADESAKLGKEVMQSDVVKDVAPYAGYWSRNRSVSILI
jgi:hypothetical protein